MEYCSTEYFKCIYGERSPGIWMQYNYDCDPSLYNFRFASSKINILFLGLCTLTEFSWIKCQSVGLTSEMVLLCSLSLSPLWHQKSAFSIPHLNDMQCLKQGSVEQHDNKSSCLSSKYTHLFKAEKYAFPKACLYINPAQGHFWYVLSLLTWLLYTTACFSIA